MASEPPTPLGTISITFSTDQIKAQLDPISDAVERFRDWLYQYRTEFYEVCAVMMAASLGTAGSLVASCIIAYEGVLRLIPVLVDSFSELAQWVWAPDNINDLARAMGPAIDEAQACSEALMRDAMPANDRWKGPACDAYYTYIDTTQKKASDAVYQAMKDVQTSISEIGDAAVLATYAALGAIMAALFDALGGLIALIPPATPAGAALIGIAVALLAATLAAYIEWAKSQQSAKGQALRELSGRIDGYFPGGSWPQLTGYEARSSIDNPGGWEPEPDPVKAGG